MLFLTFGACWSFAFLLFAVFSLLASVAGFLVSSLVSHATISYALNSLIGAGSTVS